MVLGRGNVSDLFEEILSDLKCQENTKAYIISIYGKFKSANFDLSKESITLLFSQAKSKQDFLTYQNIADYLFFIKSWAPQFLKSASMDYYDTVARLSYYSCFNITRKQLFFYEQLADDFIFLTEQAKNKLSKLY
jgi:hypothetical protein